MNLIWEKWLEHLESKPEAQAIVHITFDKKPYVWTYKSLFECAIQMMKYLKQNGVKQGDVCGIIMKHNKYFYPTYLGASILGSVTTVLAYKNPKLHPDKFIKGLEGMSMKSGLDWILTENELEDIIKPIVSSKDSTIKNIFCPLNIFDHKPKTEIDLLEELDSLKKAWKKIKPEDPFLLQHSSGTTGLQKGVSLSHNAILDHSKFYGDAIELNDNDKIISWLPLYHDMGLIAAFTIPLIKGITTVQIDPFDWITEPVMLMEVISEHRGTLVWLPNFSYMVLANKVHSDDIKNLDLSSIRMLINCSEPVSFEAHDRMYSFYKNNGLKENCFGVCYAMAETTFAITQTKPGERARVLYVDRDSLANGKVIILNKESEKIGRYCVSSGKPILGCTIKILSEDGKELAESFSGEIAVNSVSLFDGYKNNAEKTVEVLNNGCFHSGDIGFIHDGECFVIGRKKDIIIVAGKNIYPEDIEAVINKVDGVIPGRVVAFGVYNTGLGTDQVNIAVETQLFETEHKKLAQLILKNALENDISITCVHVKPPKWLIKSSSGKLSRNENKNRILNELN
jgi:fatty-acyl-CoA synthase